jgi:hypothetical protein
LEHAGDDFGAPATDFLFAEDFAAEVPAKGALCGICGKMGLETGVADAILDGTNVLRTCALVSGGEVG